MRDEFLPFAPPFYDEREVAAVAEALRSGWITTGPRTRDFESRFAAACAAPAALGCSSCTAGLHLALLGAGVGPGDEVIVPSMTFCATANVVVHVGARPVIVDVCPTTLCIAPAAIDAAMNERTRAVMVVHYAGHPAELDALQAVCRARGVTLIEDAAHAIGARYRGVAIGGAGNPAAFSFYATKNLATGEGGMLTGQPALIERARLLALHGMSNDAWKRYDKAGSWQYDVPQPGFKYNMTDVQAALGLVQLDKLPVMQARRRAVAARYAAGLADCAAVSLPPCAGHVEHAWHLYVIRLRRTALCIDRDRFVEELRRRNIGASVHFIPLHRQSYYRRACGVDAATCPQADAAFH
ncbi:MAG: DegT/DnrJ/EryC1/StrS family aminotransferase, partial [Planctomycetota bacterium]